MTSGMVRTSKDVTMGDLQRSPKDSKESMERVQRLDGSGCCCNKQCLRYSLLPLRKHGYRVLLR